MNLPDSVREHVVITPYRNGPVTLRSEWSSSEQVASSSRAGEFMKKRIVVVEDNPSDIHLLKMAFEEAHLDCDVLSFSDGEAALNYVRRNTAEPPAVIVIDVNVPRADGAEILTEIRKTAHFDDVPVIAISSSSSPRDIKRIRELGGTLYLVKPADLDEFMKIGLSIKECIENSLVGKRLYS